MKAKTDVLFTLGEPDNTPEWYDYLQYGFNQSDVPALLAILADKSLRDTDSHLEVWVPVHAWRALGQLRSTETVQPLLDLFEFWSVDDCASVELPQVMGMIGEPAFEPLVNYFQNSEHGELARITAAGCLTNVGVHHPVLREQVVALIRQYMAQADGKALGLNSVLIGCLTDLKATEAIDEIREFYDRGYVSQAVAGDLQGVEISLGLRERRTTPLPNFQTDVFRRLEKPKTVVSNSPKVGRNEPCPCGSGKKYKKCCLNVLRSE